MQQINSLKTLVSVSAYERGGFIAKFERGNGGHMEGVCVGQFRTITGSDNIKEFLSSKGYDYKGIIK